MEFYSIILATLFCSPLFCMELPHLTDVTIITSDQKEYTVPRWQIRESNTLYTLFLEELQKSPDVLPVCIATPTLSHEEIELYSTALKQDDFDSYYKNHFTLEQQRMLVVAAGQHARNKENELISKLHDVALSIKLLSLDSDNDMLNDIFPLLPPVWCIIDHFKRKAIIDNATQKKYTQMRHDYSQAHLLCPSSQNDYFNVLPSSLQTPINHRVSALFEGITYRLGTLWTHSDNSQWEILQCITPSYTNMSYVVTKTVPEDQKASCNKINVWANYPKEKEILLKQICHPNEIEKMVFSNNSKTLAISSTCPENEGMLSLLSLEMENDALKSDTEIIITDYPGWHETLCFTSKSNLLVASVESRLIFWDAETGKNIFSLPCPGKKIELVSFNCDDTRLAVASQDYQELDEPINPKYAITLYDISILLQPIIITTLDLTDPAEPISPMSMKFDLYDNKLLIGTTNQALVIDEQSGQIIMATEKVAITDSVAVHPLLIPKLNILATTTAIHELPSCTTQLWDISSKKLIATLVEGKENMWGVGITPNNSSIISTFVPDHSMIKTDLWFSQQIIDTRNTVCALLKKLTLFQRYCLYRIDKENEQHKKCIPIHRQSLLYKGIKTLPEEIKDVMYNVFHILHAYGSRK